MSKRVVIVGGGLAGLIASLMLSRRGVSVEVFEKRSYPFHRVCGEYISMETRRFLESIGCYPTHLDPPLINQLQLTSVNGREVVLPLASGGFGVSRYAFDHFLYQQAQAAGVRFHLNREVRSVVFQNDIFLVGSDQEEVTADIVIGSYGKRSVLDKSLQRNFMTRRSPWAGVKYHIRIEHSNNRISLHNFHNGYCGMSNVEHGMTNLCYLTHRDNIRQYQSVAAMEAAVLHQNPFLREILTHAEFVFDRPEVINEISFATKEPVHGHVLMAGDAAGMITPLCGNGMAMAIRSGKVVAEMVASWCESPAADRKLLEARYAQWWREEFATHLWTGRQIQRLFGGVWSSNAAVALGRYWPGAAQWLVSQTHGQPI